MKFITISPVLYKSWLILIIFVRSEGMMLYLEIANAIGGCDAADTNAEQDALPLPRAATGWTALHSSLLDLLDRTQMSKTSQKYF